MSDFVGYGAALSLAVVVVILFFVLVEQSAARWAVAAGVLGAGAVGAVEWWLFSINRAMAEFMLVPSILLGLTAMYWSARTIYRRLAVIPPAGATKESEPEIKVEDETLERQNELWCKLRDLPQFRETLKGDLINLLSGDVLSWASVNNARCIEMELAGKTVLTASRFGTLRKYWGVQQAVANLLFPRGAE